LTQAGKLKPSVFSQQEIIKRLEEEKSSQQQTITEVERQAKEAERLQSLVTFFFLFPFSFLHLGLTFNSFMNLKKT